jgi:tetratricopeptide (TPR) repeat protein
MQGIKSTIMSEQSEKLLGRAALARRENRPEDAKRDLIEAVAFCRDTGDNVDLARSLTGLGQIERDLGDDAAALKYYEEAVMIYREMKDALKLAHTIRHVADIHRHENQTSLADGCYREALDLYRNHERTQPLELANAIRGFAILKSDAGETIQAKSLWEEARDLYALVGVKEGVAESARRLAGLAART